MSDANDLLLVTEDGTVRATGRGMERRLRERAGRYRFVVDSPSVILMRREPTGAQRGPRVLMAGEVLSRMTMLEIVNVIATAGWRGELTVTDEDGNRRLLSFDQGSVKHGESSHADDRLGEVLYRHGVIDRDQLDELLSDVSPDKRFGQLCLEKGFIDQERLFQYLQKQVEQIFYATLLVSTGGYLFALPDEAAQPPATTVHISVQGLLMEGVQRIDEMALFRERIPSSALHPEVIPGAPEKKIDKAAQTVLGVSDGSRTITDIARETGLGEFMTTKAIYQLLQAGLVKLHAGTQVDAEAVRRLIAQFNAVMRDIFMAVATYGGVDQTRATLAAWIQGSGYAPYFGNEVEEDGSIEPNFVIRALEGLESDHPVEALHQALHELAAFALFAATTSLPRDQELLLSRDVNRRLKAIRI